MRARSESETIDAGAGPRRVASERAWQLGLMALLVFGVLVRFHRLDDKIFWHDETYTQIFVAGYQGGEWQPDLFSGRVLGVDEVVRYRRHDPRKSAWDTILGLARSEPQHPPLYYVIARQWIAWFGDGERTLRLLSVWTSLLGFPAVYWLARELFVDRRVAWTSVALFAVSPFFVLYAQEAREYQLWALLLVLQLAALHRGLRLAGERGLRAFTPYAAFTVLALYTSLSTVTVLLAEGIGVALLALSSRDRALFARYLAASAFALLLFAPWGVLLVEHFDAFRASMAWSSEIVIPRQELFGWLGVNISRTLVDLGDGLEDSRSLLAIGLMVPVLVGALGRLGRAPIDARLLVLALVLVPLGFMFIPDVVGGGIRSLSARYHVPAWIGVLLALAFAVAGEGPRASARSALGIGLIALAVASCVRNAGRDDVWTKGISVALPAAAAAIGETPAPLVLGSREQHHPGNLLALSAELPPGAHLVFLPLGRDEYQVPAVAHDALFVLGATPQMRAAIARDQGGELVPVVDTLHLKLWRLERPPQSP